METIQVVSNFHVVSMAVKRVPMSQVERNLLEVSPGEFAVAGFADAKAVEKIVEGRSFRAKKRMSSLQAPEINLSQSRIGFESKKRIVGAGGEFVIRMIVLAEAAESPSVRACFARTHALRPTTGTPLRIENRRRG